MSFNNTKCDQQLGIEVHNHLVNLQVETPMAFDLFAPKAESAREKKISDIESNFENILKILGLNLDDDSLQETAKRVAKMYVNEIFWGLDPRAFPKCTTVKNKMHYDEMVVEKNINVQSTCEHHFVVINGKATVAYIPNEKVLGLSKINRIVEYFSKRPQIQERLVEQIYHALQYILNTDNIAVLIGAEHFCVKSRGVEDTGSSTVTSKLGGCFKSDAAVRAEFMNIAHYN